MMLFQFLFMLCATQEHNNAMYNKLPSLPPPAETSEDMDVEMSRPQLEPLGNLVGISESEVENQALEVADSDIGKKIGIFFGAIIGITILGTGIYFTIKTMKTNKKDISKAENANKKRLRRSLRK